MAGKGDDLIKVLVVDDIPETREMLKKILAFEPDIEVVAAASTGREGLEYASEFKPDVILMDINMPDMDGITATEEIKKIVPTAAVVMMSVQSESDYLRRAMLAGARDFLTKPISGENLYETIRRVYDLNADTRVQYSQMSSSAVGATGGKSGAAKGQAGGHIVAVYSPQGGCGVTTIATNLAVSLMREGTRVLLVDADLQFGDVDVFLNLKSKHTIVDLAESVGDFDEELAENVMVTHGSGLKVLLGPPSPDEAERVVPEDVAKLIKELSRFYDFIIVDMAKRLDDVALSIMDMAERIILIGTPTLPSVKNIRLILDLFLRLDYPPEKLMFVMNRVNTEARGRASIPIDAVENHLKRKTDARIPMNEQAFLSAVNQGVSVIATEPNKSPASDLIALAERLRRSVEGTDDMMEESVSAQQKRQSRLSGIFGGRG